jgi:hypothetical protein
MGTYVWHDHQSSTRSYASEPSNLGSLSQDMVDMVNLRKKPQLRVRMDLPISGRSANPPIEAIWQLVDDWLCLYTHVHLGSSSHVGSIHA